MPPLLLPSLAIHALCCLALGAGGLVADGSGPVSAHLAFAAGALPLILAAIIYFVPVLTRSGPPSRRLTLIPLGALAAGWLALGTLAGRLPWGTLGLAAALAASAAFGLIGWILHRKRQTLGRAHPGLAWYLAALGFLVLALAAATAAWRWPAQHAAWRLLHLHANLLGFVGLTALGTLQVLLPTCVGHPDPSAALRLRRDLPWAGAGTLAVAVGAAGLPALAVAGAMALLWAWSRLLIDSLRHHGRALWPWHGAAAALTAALIGQLALLMAGIAHGLGLIGGRPAIVGLMLAFLLPLISGAASHLLPIWWRPGQQTKWHTDLRTRLARWSGARSLTLVLLGLWLMLRH